MRRSCASKTARATRNSDHRTTFTVLNSAIYAIDIAEFRSVHELEQAELFPAALRPDEVIGRQFRAPLVESQFLASDFEPTANHPGHRAGALHPRSPLRIVDAPPTHVADQREDVAI